MAEQYFHSVGRRKTAVAQARVSVGGSGKVTVNGRPMEEVFTTQTLQLTVVRPLTECGKREAFDVELKTVGGGIVGQADAARLAIARALVKMDEALKPALKAPGLLTRDPRKKERKKPGKRGARRSPQWRKR
jgi:small subunit ribosomal protein S9